MPDGRAAATQLVLLGDHPVTHSVCAGAEPEWQKLGTTPYLRWKVFEQLAELGYAADDLTDAALNPVTRFKSQLGAELTTAVREKIPLTVIIFNDGKLGIIRLMQLEHTGHEFAVGVQNPNYEQLARSLGVSYARWDNLTSPGLPDILIGSEVKLLEVPLIDSPAIRKMRMSGRTRNVIRTLLGPQATARLKKWLGR